MSLPEKPDYSNFRKEFRGGNDTARETALLPMGGYSRIVNMRQRHPGMDQRPGQTKLHTVADGANRVMSLFQFSKAKITERHLFAQMSDGDVLEAAAAPPATTVGAFGSEVFSGAAGQVPASWSTIGDMLLYSNGADQHQIYAGEDHPVSRFIVYKGSAAIPAIPEDGTDYSTEISTADTATYAQLGSLATLAAFDCLFIGIPVMANQLNFTIDAGYVNSSVATIGVKYRKNDNTWADVADLVDNSTQDGHTLGMAGTFSITFTKPTDAMPCYMFGSSMYWLQVYLSAGALSADVRVSYATFDGPWQSIINLWDGVPVDPVEVFVYKAATGTYERYSAASVDLSGLTASDKIYLASVDPIEGIYADPGEAPSTTAGVSVNKVYYPNGAGFATVGTIEEQTAGFTKAGWITFNRIQAYPSQFNKSKYYAYWYAIETTGGTLSDDTFVGFKVIPYFDIADFGKSLANIVWKSRAMWVFDKYPSWILASAKNLPMTLNGDDFAILEAGDGRMNRIVCMKRFHNEYMVWQEEDGTEGGCLTLFEGYSPATYGKLVLSTSVGTFNAHSAVVVDGVMTSTATDEEIKTLAFFLSHDGVCMCDGKTVKVISDEIGNYFNPLKSECIRNGYEDRMWLKYDRAFNIIRIGLVSGAAATECNVFPVFDLTDKTWSFDELGQKLACMAEIEAGSGNVRRLQVGGGTVDGTIYQLNVGQDDCDTAIDSYVDMEFDGKGDVISITEAIIRTVAGSGVCTITAWEDGVAVLGRQWTIP